MSIASTNPATGEIVERFEPLSDSLLEDKLAQSARAFHGYRTTTFAQRAAWLEQAAAILEQQSDRLGRLMTTEMGKPLSAAIAEAKKSATACRYYVQNGERLLQDQQVRTEAPQSFLRFQPLGPVLAIMPWNFPFWQVFRFAAPALMAGNAVLLKHASNVPRCAIALQEIFDQVGLPSGVFQSLLVGSDRVERLLADRRVAAVTLTGSVEAGRKVAALAGYHLKKSVLELGGSDPFIVMPSAPLAEAVEVAVNARLLNNGQSCIAAKRFLVAQPLYEEFEHRFVERLQQLKIGDPLDPSTELGPLATAEVLASVEAQVEASVRAGARCLTGGHRLQRPGWFYAPTALASIPEQCPADQEEVFGPVASLFCVRDLSHALQIANSTCFGLGASVWTADPLEQQRLLNEIEAGMVFVNGMVVSDPRLPFGGIKDSGYGRELGALGIVEFTNAKTVVIRHAKN